MNRITRRSFILLLSRYLIGIAVAFIALVLGFPAFRSKLTRKKRLLPQTAPSENAAIYVIAEPCIGTKDRACVDACPVNCIHPTKDDPPSSTDQLFIDPVECISCGACVPVCPVSAIFALDDLPQKWKAYAKKNAKYYGRYKD